MLRKRQIYIDRFGPEVGERLYHALQSQAAHAGVSARLRRKLQSLERGDFDLKSRTKPRTEELPLFPEPWDAPPAPAESDESQTVGAGPPVAASCDRVA